MSVKRKKILLDNLGRRGGSINIPLGSKFFPVDNSEIIENELIPKEKEKVINPIIDYKKIIFKPADNNWDVIPAYKINLNFFIPSTVTAGAPEYRGASNGANGPGVYEDLNFSYDDLFFNSQLYQ